MVSIIVPVYNLEEYIAFCLNSILRQTYNDFEVIVVDDGSTDSSADVCRAYCDRDPRVRLITQHNTGVSAARNTGFAAAQGNMIAFVDGDDIIAPDYLECLVKAADGNVLAMCMHERVTGYDYPFADTGEPFGQFSAEECAKRVLSGNFPVSAWGGILFRDKIGSLRFPIGIRNNEDKLFIYSYLLQNEKGSVSFTNRKMYGYYVRQGSASKTAWNGSTDTILMADEMYGLTQAVHPDWLDLAEANRISVRLDTLKTIVMSGKKTAQANQAYSQIKREVLALRLPSCASKTVKIEYGTLKLGDIAFKTLVKAYYGLMNDRWRMKRNESMTKQRKEHHSKLPS